MKHYLYIWSIFCFSLLIACSSPENKSNSAQPIKKKVTSTSSQKSDDKKETEDVKKVEEPKAQTTPLPPGQLAKAKEIIASVNQADVDKVDGAKKFKLFCSTCHGFKGDMMVNGAKDLTVSEIDMVNAVAQVYHGKGLMTPYKGVLKDHEIVAVCNYIQTLRK